MTRFPVTGVLHVWQHTVIHWCVCDATWYECHTVWPTPRCTCGYYVLVWPETSSKEMSHGTV
jgi:hypothetical protein